MCNMYSIIINYKLDVAVKQVEKKKTRVPESEFYYNTNGHPNVINFFCFIASDPKFT